MRIDLNLPGGHGAIHLPGDNWPGLSDLETAAGLLAESTRACPDCPGVTVEEILLAMARTAPAHLAPGLRARAGAPPALPPMSPRLAAMYQDHADGLANIEAAYQALGER